MRFRMSCYQMSVFINLVLKTVGIDDPTKLTSPKGIWNKRKRVGKQTLETHAVKCSNLLELDFDGTTCPEALPHNQSKTTHFLGMSDGLASEGITSYVNHEKCRGSGLAMSEALIRTIDDTNSRDSLLVMGSDNTAANSSPTVRAHCLVEQNLKRPLQRNYCLNHMAERPFRNFLELFDGKTVGPIGTDGPLGRAMRKLDKEQGPFVQFDRIENNLPPNLDIAALPEDLKFLCTLVNYISTGDIDPYYETKPPPPHDNARWRNDCTRCCSVFCRTTQPEDIPGLIELVKFICQCYAPMVIEVYFEPQLVNGPHHIFTYLKRTQACLSPDHFNYVKKYFHINGGYFHPENVMVGGLLSMYHTTIDINLRALKWQIRAREYHKDRKDVRIFVPPKEHQVNYDATNFFDFLDWENLPMSYITPSPCLSIYTIDELKDFLNLIFPNYKCHQSECERVMQDIENAVLKNVGHPKQKESLVCTNESRNEHNYKKFKKDEFL